MSTPEPTQDPDPDELSDIASTGSFSDSGSDYDSDDEPLIPFRLLSLPAALRLRIGKLAISTTPGIYWWRLQNKTPGLKASPAIARVCRVLRQDLLSYFYQTRVDIICQNTDHLRPLGNVGAWIAAVAKEQRQHVRGVKVRVKGESEVKWERVEQVWKGVYGLEFEGVDEEVCERNGENRVWRIKFS